MFFFKYVWRDGLYHTSIHMLELSQKSHSLSFSLLPILSSLTFSLSLKCASENREKQEQHRGGPHRRRSRSQTEMIEENPSGVPDWNSGGSVFAERSEGRRLRGGNLERREYQVLFIFNYFCCFDLDFIPQCPTLWLRWNDSTSLWILGRRGWCLPKFRLFFFFLILNFTFFSFTASGKINK